MAAAFEFHASRLFPSWLAQTGASIAFTTYQAGKVFLIGLNENGQLHIFERTFERPMGLGLGARRFWMSSLHQIWRFEGFLDPGQTHDGYDQRFVPVTGHTTGDIDTHDIHEDANGRPIFVATRFNCLATLSEDSSFREIWRPPFIDRLAAEDRCHLNGLAMKDGAPAYVTTISETNVLDGWREHRRCGGTVYDVKQNARVAGGLSMPHSPRFHQGKLWILQSGTGEFGHVDVNTGRFEPICFVPGFARGLQLTETHAIIGISRPRKNRTFDGLVLNDRLECERTPPRCAVCVINLKTGNLEHQLEIQGIIQEVFDVTLLSQTRKPMALGFRTEEIRFFVKPEC
jgi:uncharacterized protein (TIGR03032 family)